MIRYLTTIIERDVGKLFVSVSGVKYFIGSAIGRVQQIDVGKRVYIKNNVITVENQEQKATRLGERKS